MSDDTIQEIQEPSSTLPFEKNKQFAVLGHLLGNERFFLQASGKILPEWFSDPYANRVLTEKVNFYKEFGRCPSLEEIRNRPSFRLEEQRYRNRINEAISTAMNYSGEYGLDSISRELTDWLHAQVYQHAIRQSARLYNTQKPKEAYRVVEEAMKDIRDTQFDQDNEANWDTMFNGFEQKQAEEVHGMTFGVSVFDKLLRKTTNGKGCLLPGDTSVILAPTNVGKTTSMITVARHNVFLGKHILFISHEGRQDDLMSKMMCAMLDCTNEVLLGKFKTQDGMRELDFCRQWLKRYLHYVPMNKPGLCVEDVAAVVRKKQEELKAKNHGRGYDMLVNDYPAKLTTQQNKSGVLSKRIADEIVYNYFVQLGLEYNMHVVCAIQTNREGSKVNKGQGDSHRLLTMEDVQESWGPMTSATNVWTINRNPSDKIAKRLIYHIDKSRSSEVGWAVVCKTNYAHSLTHSDSLGATYFRGESTHIDKLDKFLDQYLDQEMPEHVLLAE